MHHGGPLCRESPYATFVVSLDLRKKLYESCSRRSLMHQISKSRKKSATQLCVPSPGQRSRGFSHSSYPVYDQAMEVHRESYSPRNSEAIAVDFNNEDQDGDGAIHWKCIREETGFASYVDYSKRFIETSSFKS